MPSDPRAPEKATGASDPRAADAAGSTGPSAAWDGSYERRRPTLAELAVPWLIGFILLLVGLVVLLLILLFTEQDGTALGRRAFPTPIVGGVISTIAPSASSTPRPIGGPVETPRDAGGPAPSTPAEPFPFGETELAFLARATPLAPIELRRDDFSTADAATTLAFAVEGVQAHDWAPDGSAGVALVAGIAVAVEPGADPRRLADGVSAVAFGENGATVYAVRVAPQGAQGESQTATVIGLDYASAEERVITEVTYPTPVLTFPGRVEEAQFADDGGPIRLHWLDDGRIGLSVAGGPSLAIDPADGAQESLERAPLLWSPDGGLRVAVSAADGATTLEVLDGDGAQVATTTVGGAVSHLRWAPRGDRVVFTVGVGTPGGGVRQDLYVWSVASDGAVTALTANGASFGGEWLGAKEIWRA